jgi:hypothetical protein
MSDERRPQWTFENGMTVIQDIDRAPDGSFWVVVSVADATKTHRLLWMKSKLESLERSYVNGLADSTRAQLALLLRTLADEIDQRHAEFGGFSEEYLQRLTS